MKLRTTKNEQRGVAAVEFALILLASVFLLPVVLLFARVFYHYNVLKQATQDAANAMAATPRIEMATSSGMNAAKARSSQMVFRAIADAGIAPSSELFVDLYCNGAQCIPGMPLVEVRATATFVLFDDFYRQTFRWLPDAYGPSWTFSAASDARYQN